jgi:hypothetical protein
MANISNQQVWAWDTIGVFIPGPIKVRKASLIPNAAGDACEFKSCNIQQKKSEIISGTCTVTGTNQIVSTGNFTAANVAVGDIIQIYASNSLNLGWYIVATRPDNDTITVVGTPLTNEASKVYSWRVYTGFSAGQIKTQATNMLMDQLDFGPSGYDFPGGLGLLSLSASAKVYLYR